MQREKTTVAPEGFHWYGLQREILICKECSAWVQPTHWKDHTDRH